MFQGGVGEAICGHLAAASAAAGAATAECAARNSAAAAAGGSAAGAAAPPPLPAALPRAVATAQLAAAIAATMADWPGFESGSRRAGAAWLAARAASGAVAPALLLNPSDPYLYRAGGSPAVARREAAAAADAAAASEGGAAPLPALHALLADLAARLPPLLAAAGRAEAAGRVAERGPLAQLLETHLLVSHALSRVLESAGRAARNALRRRLAAPPLGLGAPELDAALAAGRLDWLLLSRVTGTGGARRGGGARGGGGDVMGAATTVDAVAALPPSLRAATLLLLSPAAASCAGTHRFVNAAAVGIVSLWADALGDGCPGSNDSSSAAAAAAASGSSAAAATAVDEAKAARCRRELLAAFGAAGGCGRLAALLDDSHDDADKAPTFQSRDAQRGHKRAVAAAALGVARRLLRWADEAAAAAPPATPAPEALGGGAGGSRPPSARRPASGAKAAGTGATNSPAAALPEEGVAQLARSALGLAGDWLSWVCVASLEALGTEGAAEVGRAVSEVMRVLGLGGRGCWGAICDWMGGGGLCFGIVRLGPPSLSGGCQGSQQTHPRLTLSLLNMNAPPPPRPRNNTARGARRALAAAAARVVARAAARPRPLLARGTRAGGRADGRRGADPGRLRHRGVPVHPGGESTSPLVMMAIRPSAFVVPCARFASRPACSSSPFPDPRVAFLRLHPSILTLRCYRARSCNRHHPPTTVTTTRARHPTRTSTPPSSARACGASSRSPPRVRTGAAAAGCPLLMGA